MNYKNVITFILVSIFVYASSVFADLNFVSQFGDARFQPSDTYHAGCLSEWELSLSSVNKAGQAHIVLNYNPDELHVTKFRWKLEGSFHVWYDQLVMDFSLEKLDGIFATLQFKSQKWIEKTFLTVDKSSYIEQKNSKKKYMDETEFSLIFSEVPECEPDVDSPSVNLLSPNEWASWVALDSYFVFDIRDHGKGVDTKSLKVSINDRSFSSRNSFKWSGSYLFFFPDDRLPVWEDVKVSVSVADKQKYGWANKVKEDFFFRTATGIVLSTDINPNMMRLFKQKKQSIYASDTECALLNQIYSDADSYYQYQLKNLMKKLECKLDLTSLVMVPDDKELNVENIENKQDTTILMKWWFSVFAIVWWLFFIVTLFLKLHYLHGYHFYKRKHKQSLSNKPSGIKKNPLM